MFAVEKDFNTARAYGLTHDFVVLEIDEAVQRMKQGEIPTKLIVHGDIEDPKVWMVASHYEVDTWVGSPPCQPWTGAAFQTGLKVYDGCLMPNFISIAGFCGVNTVLIENVATVVRHEHFRLIKKIARQYGLPLLLGSVDICDRHLSPFCCLSRSFPNQHCRQHEVAQHYPRHW